MLVATVLLAQKAAAAPPSHCKPGEFSVVNAWMGSTHMTDGGWRNARSGKFLSLCADKNVEPFTRLSYRYGASTQVELEVAATAKNPFKITSQTTSPHTGDEIVFFSRGNYTYYVSIAIGQGHGVSLQVYQGNEPIANHFSGNFGGEDYQLGPAEIDFFSDHPVSKIFIRAEPEHF